MLAYIFPSVKSMLFNQWQHNLVSVGYTWVTKYVPLTIYKSITFSGFGRERILFSVQGLLNKFECKILLIVNILSFRTYLQM